MFKFNYEEIISKDKPLFTCIVPTTWMARNLPTMDGSVVYVDNKKKESTFADIVFEFSEQSMDGLARTVYLDIYHRQASGNDQPESYAKLLAAPATIHYRAIADHDANDVWCAELVLLNHFIGRNALSASMGNIYFDYSDLESIMRMSSDFTLEFGIGDTPADILPNILERFKHRAAKCVFAVMLCKSQKMKLAYLRETLAALDSEDALIFVTDVAVDQEKMLISVLIGH